MVGKDSRWHKFGHMDVCIELVSTSLPMNRISFPSHSIWFCFFDTEIKNSNAFQYNVRGLGFECVVVRRWCFCQILRLAVQFLLYAYDWQRGTNLAPMLLSGVTGMWFSCFLISPFAVEESLTIWILAWHLLRLFRVFSFRNVSGSLDDRPLFWMQRIYDACKHLLCCWTHRDSLQWLI